jgi:uncharacterized protein YggE
MAEQTFVEVTGFGSATTTPDRLRAHLAAVSGAPTVAQAFSGASEAMQAMLSVLREHGVADEDLRSTGIQVHSDHEYRGIRGRFEADMSLEALLRDIDSAGTVLSAAVEAGGDASRVHGISLDSSAAEDSLSEAREGAWADATAKAEQYAELAGRSLGAVLSVSELGAGAVGCILLARPCTRRQPLSSRARVACTPPSPSAGSSRSGPAAI